MNFTDYRNIAKTVLLTAQNVDQRHADAWPSDNAERSEKIDVWATIFSGHVWPAEAKAAVLDHYSQPRAFSITPGDVVAYCQSQPVWSSAEHVQDWLSRVGVQNPYSGIIEAYSGISEPILRIPAHVGREGEKAYLIEELSRWVANNRDALVAAILERRYVPWFQGGAA